MKPLEEVRLYCFSPGSFLMGRDPIEMVAAQIRGGADVIQLREKDMPKREKLELGRAVKNLAAREGALFIVNDDLDLALILEADGVHLGQDDIPIQYARPLLKDKIIGISTHSLEQARQAIDSGADYIGIGPVFETETKIRVDQVVGIDLVLKVKALSSIPVIAIGGIGENNIDLLVDRGIKRAAIISDILSSDDIEAKTRALKEKLRNV
ncbi:MAG: thiamine phosphate synthase [Deltaproteobacteria bacterium]|nr:MAG: thiamine phosphate synthase [Deltaproteobacteria bacterium]